MLPSNILGQILEQKRLEVAALRANLEFLRHKAPDRTHLGSFKMAITRHAGEPIKLIAEIKKKSPSLGNINASIDIIDVATTYHKAGVDAISVLSDERFFGGSLRDISSVASAVSSPILRKDFIISEEQIKEAALAGASAVLLITRVMDGRAQLKDFLGVCRHFGLDALVETETIFDIEIAVAAGAEIIGVNARNLDTLAMDFGNFERLLPQIPPGIVRVAESGITSRTDVLVVDTMCDAMLVGSAIMQNGLAGMTRKVAELRGL